MQRRGEGSPGPTPLMSAAERGDREAVALLVERGADVNAKEGGEGRTALMGAAHNGCPDVVRHLLRAGADASLCDRRRPHHSELGRRPRLRAHPRPSRSRPALDVGSAAIAVGATSSSRPPRSHCRAAANATDPTLLPRPRPKRPRQRSPRRARHHHRLYLRPQGLGGPP